MLKTAIITGSGRRSANEDAIRVFQDKIYQGIILADGMGGALAGEVASRMVAEEMLTLVHGLPQHDPLPPLLAGISRINEKIYQASLADRRKEGMGSTLMLALTDGRRFWVVHVGDSRAYYFKENDVLQLTRDHSVEQDSLEKGLISEDQLGKGPYKHALTQCLGGAEDPQPGVYGPAEFEPGALILLCSDGLSGFVSETELLNACAAAASITQTADYLLRLAYFNGSDDNISIGLLERGVFLRLKESLPPLPRLPVPKKKTARQNRLGSLLTIMITLLAVLVYFTWHYHQKQKVTVSDPASSTVAVMEEPAPSEANWVVWPQNDQIFGRPPDARAGLHWRFERHEKADLEIRDHKGKVISKNRVGRDVLLRDVLPPLLPVGTYEYYFEFEDGRRSPVLWFSLKEEKHDAAN